MAQLTAGIIEIYRGEPVTIPFGFDPEENITGHTLVFTVAKDLDKSTKVLGPIAMSATDASVGEFEVALTEEETDIKPATYKYDVWRIDEGFEGIKAIGDFVVLANVRVPPVE
jgi:hypothetical protein